LQFSFQAASSETFGYTLACKLQCTVPTKAYRRKKKKSHKIIQKLNFFHSRNTFMNESTINMGLRWMKYSAMEFRHFSTLIFNHDPVSDRMIFFLNHYATTSIIRTQSHFLKPNLFLFLGQSVQIAQNLSKSLLFSRILDPFHICVSFFFFNVTVYPL
jgi:hypothetical protein